MPVPDGSSSNTRRAYANAWGRFERWCAAQGREPLPATEQTLVEYVYHLAEDTACSSSTAQVALAAIRQRHRLAQVEWPGGVLVRHALADLRGQREAEGVQAKPAAALSPEQAGALLAAADADDVRSSALVALMLFTGASVAELLSADVSQVEGGVLRIPGRGRRARVLPLAPAVRTRLSRYLETRAPDVLPLVATSTGQRLKPTQVRRIMLRCGSRADLDAEVMAGLTPQSARATFAVLNLAAGASLRDVQYALGHADPRSTEHYDRGDARTAAHPALRLAEVIDDPAG